VEAELTLAGTESVPGAELDALDGVDEQELAEEALGAAVAAEPPFAFTGNAGRPDPEARRRDAIYRRLLAGADALAFALAFALGTVAVERLAPTPFALLVIPALIVAAKALGLYDRDQHLVHKTTLDEVPKLFHLSVLSAFVVFLSGGVLVSGTIGPAGSLVVAVTLFAGITTTRSIARVVAKNLAPPERCVVLGDREIADELAAKLAASGGTTVEFVGHLDHSGSLNGNGSERTAGISEFLVDHQIQRVVIAPGADDSADMLALVGEIKSLGIKISVLPSVSMAGGISFELDRINGTTLLGVRGFEFGRSSQVLKRSMDLAISGAALLALAPLIAVAALAIKATSPGPVFYRQVRVGRHGKPFRMLKLRTMYENAHKRRAELGHLNEAIGGLFKIADDPRVTRVGRVLRSLSLDEVPQLWHVLRGEMSLVGPRPLVVEEDRLIQGWHRQRLSLTPGMTGYWQVLGSARVPLDEMVKLDYAYVQNWSAWHDVQLLLRTIPFVARRRGL
jgi:exopolysaccharide biosynthesis polyprenyl glycosylphosphotransferase